MLNLSLREEFRSARLKGTVVELTDDRSTGAVQVAPPQFLDITYPTHDVLKSIEAVNEGQGRPVVVIGERGLGKSHILAVLHHTLNDPAAVLSWLASWKDTIEPSTLDAIKLRSTKMHVITENLDPREVRRSTRCANIARSAIVTAGSTLMSGKGQMPEMASNSTRRPMARLVVAGGVCQRDRLSRSTALSMCNARIDHFVKRCVANERLVSSRGKVGRSRPSIISTAGKAIATLAAMPSPGTRMAIARMSSSNPKARF
jgi:hypothetical protein